MMTAWWTDLRRRTLLAAAPGGALERYLATPFPSPRLDYREVRFLALDFETTGLNPKRGAILSFGYLSVEGARIRLSEANCGLVRSTRAVEKSATIHGIFDDALAEGLAPKAALDAVLTALTGRALLVHHAPIELGFLNAACRRHYGSPFVARTVDTLALARRRLERRAQPFGAEALRLYALREQRGLPRYRGHDALTDALATAELFLTVAAEMAQSERLPLRRLLY